MNTPETSSMDLQAEKDAWEKAEMNRPARIQAIYDEALNDQMLKGAAAAAVSDTPQSTGAGGVDSAYLKSQFELFWIQRGASLMRELDEQGQDPLHDTLGLEEARLRKERGEKETQIDDLDEEIEKNETKREKLLRRLSVAREALVAAPAPLPQPWDTAMAGEGEGSATASLDAEPEPEAAPAKPPHVRKLAFFAALAAYLGLVTFAVANLLSYLDKQKVEIPWVGILLMIVAALVFPWGLKALYNQLCKLPRRFSKFMPLLGMMVPITCAVAPLPALLFQLRSNQAKLNELEQLPAGSAAEKARNAKSIADRRAENEKDIQFDLLLISLGLDIGLTPLAIYFMGREINAYQIAKGGMSPAEYEADQRIVAALEAQIVSDRTLRSRRVDEFESLQAGLKQVEREQAANTQKQHEECEAHWRQIFEKAWGEAHQALLNEAKRAHEDALKAEALNALAAKAEMERKEHEREAQAAQHEYELRKQKEVWENDINAQRAQNDQNRLAADATLKGQQMQADLDEIKAQQSDRLARLEIAKAKDAKDIEHLENQIKFFTAKEATALHELQEALKEKKKLMERSGVGTGSSSNSEEQEVSNHLISKLKKTYNDASSKLEEADNKLSSLKAKSIDDLIKDITSTDTEAT